MRFFEHQGKIYNSEAILSCKVRLVASKATDKTRKVTELKLMDGTSLHLGGEEVYASFKQWAMSSIHGNGWDVIPGTQDKK